MQAWLLQNPTSALSPVPVGWPSEAEAGTKPKGSVRTAPVLCVWRTAGLPGLLVFVLPPLCERPADEGCSRHSVASSIAMGPPGRGASPQAMRAMPAPLARAKTRVLHYTHTYGAAEPCRCPSGPAATPLPRRRRYQGTGPSPLLPAARGRADRGSLRLSRKGRSSPPRRVSVTSRHVALATAAEEGQGVMAAVPAPSPGALVPVAAEAGAVVRSREAVGSAAKRPKKILDEDAYIEVGDGLGPPHSVTAAACGPARPVPSGWGAPRGPDTSVRFSVCRV